MLKVTRIYVYGKFFLINKYYVCINSYQNNIILFLYLNSKVQSVYLNESMNLRILPFFLFMFSVNIIQVNKNVILTNRLRLLKNE